MSERADQLRAQIWELVAEYTAEAFPKKQFTPGSSSVPVSGRVFDAEDIQYLVDSSLDFWLTTGRYADQFEKEFARFFKMRHTILVNSGSSANLLALTSLTSPLLKERQLQPGDEVITVASGFPTTVNPIFQNNLVPVFIDVDIPTYNVDVTQLESALSEKTRAVMIAHTLGNPFNLGAVTEFCKQHNLWLVEDCCDAVGATYNGQPVGRFDRVTVIVLVPTNEPVDVACIELSEPNRTDWVEHVEAVGGGVGASRPVVDGSDSFNVTTNTTKASMYTAIRRCRSSVACDEVRSTVSTVATSIR